MPRVPRSIETDCTYHAMNRGNGRMTLFHKPADYEAFVRVLREGLERYDVDLFAYCLMPNHWHLLLAERSAGALSAFIGWVGVTHVRRHHEHYETRGGGHLYQGRFKAFPVSGGVHFRQIAGYVEANARRAKLVPRAQAWPWGSATTADDAPPALPLAAWPCSRPRDWIEQLNEPIPEARLTAIRASATRGRPFGAPAWVAATAASHGLTHTLRGPGRPKKSAENNQ